MSRLTRLTAVTVALCGLVQSGWTAEPAAPDKTDISPARLAAGVRAYPASVLRALLEIADQPLLLRQLAEEPEKLAKPEGLYPPVDERLKPALQQLQAVPELVGVAAAFPAEIAALRRMYTESPQETESRVGDLRGRYTAWMFEGARRWQEQLERDPAALSAYRDLVAQFVRDQRKQYEDFPYVEVLNHDYYLAAPPNELIWAYAEAANVPPALRDAMNRWWQQFGPERVDEQVFSGNGPPAVEPGARFLAAMPPVQRDSMWRMPSIDALMPVILQPLDDQPVEARLAYAVAEHARLWSGSAITQAPPPESGAESQAPATTGGTGDDWVTSAPPAPAPPRPEATTYDGTDVYGPAGQYVEPYVDGVAARGGEIEVEVDDDEVEIDVDYDDDDYVVVDPGYVYESPVYVGVTYSRCYPYFYSYPWTWPVICTAYPVYYGPSAYYYYHGPGAYVNFHLGWGRNLCYYSHIPHHYYGRYYGHRYGDGHHVGHYDRSSRYWRDGGGPYSRNRVEHYGDRGRYDRSGRYGRSDGAQRADSVIRDRRGGDAGRRLAERGSDVDRSGSVRYRDGDRTQAGRDRSREASRGSADARRSGDVGRTTRRGADAGDRQTRTRETPRASRGTPTDRSSSGRSSRDAASPSRDSRPRSSSPSFDRPSRRGGGQDRSSSRSPRMSSGRSRSSGVPSYSRSAPSGRSSAPRMSPRSAPSGRSSFSAPRGGGGSRGGRPSMSSGRSGGRPSMSAGRGGMGGGGRRR